MDDLAPILDDHLHLDPNNRGVEAAEAFADAGGSHLLVVNKPSWMLEAVATDEDIFQEVFSTTTALVDRASDRLPGRAWPVLGVHPALISKLDEEGYEPDEAADLMCAGLDIAADYVSSGPALAIKSGRPHYEVDEAVLEASNRVMDHAFELASEVGCAVQLHTEGGEEFTDVAERAEARGLARERVVKHYAGGRLEGPTPSVISHKDDLELAVETGAPFMMETDFLDDPDRPGAVLGPQTVPSRVRWMADNDWTEAIERAHVETPARVYGIDTDATYSRA
ncbi:TatD family hydrolase [Halococcoides cellulosivorans]|uniref:Deoxyribonuclease n=1 Tax=Halococcoides cellulosivorans TaxID=1679096 RepID=A0A2R4WZU7_9EURY|nr:TatD family hydrolase [Halococcoides cellulosivorans]AWB27060.1 deoxyribonuclease [Halococcoides cellulosivorans]